MGTGPSIRSETGHMGFETGLEGGNGLEDVWIVGEPFFRDVQVAFNVSFTPGIFRRTKLISCVVEGEESWYAKSVTATQFCVERCGDAQNSIVNS
jgi:hypothetical protein